MQGLSLTDKIQSSRNGRAGANSTTIVPRPTAHSSGHAGSNSSSSSISNMVEASPSEDSVGLSRHGHFGHSGQGQLGYSSYQLELESSIKQLIVMLTTITNKLTVIEQRLDQLESSSSGSRSNFSSTPTPPVAIPPTPVNTPTIPVLTSVIHPSPSSYGSPTAASSSSYAQLPARTGDPHGFPFPSSFSTHTTQGSTLSPNSYHPTTSPFTPPNPGQFPAHVRP